MPYRKFDPELFHEHNGVEVYHTYDDGGIGAPADYWFTTDPTSADDFYGHGNRGQFDVRRLVGRWGGTPSIGQWEDWWKLRHTSEEAAILALIEGAIEDGALPHPVPST